MSRVGSAPIEIPKGVEIKIEKGGDFNGQIIIVKGPKGEMKESLRKNITIEVKGGEIICNRKDDTKNSKSLHGLYRSLIANMIEGVLNGYEKDLEMVGIGYRANLKGKDLELSAGYSSPKVIKAPDGIVFAVDNNVNIKVSGIDKQLVGDTAARIRALRKPEPYKGKGIRYKDEWVRRKPGKAAKAGEGAAE